MEALARLLSQEPDGFLYHYTNQAGMLGIVETNEIWATDVRFLNDWSEFHLACALALQVTKNLILKEKDPDRLDGLKELLEGPDNSGINVSVVSFSTRGDLLSQWRAYGGSSGYSLAFDHGALKSAADSQGWILAPCVYERSLQKELMTAIVFECLGTLLTRRAEGKGQLGLRRRGMDMAYALNRYAAIFKDNSFSEEREWRLISRPLSSTDAGYAYREGRSNIVPYFKFPLARDEEGKLRMKEVIIGPAPHPKLAESAVVSLLASKYMDLHPESPRFVNVKKSSIPYRNW